jgi:hypothetical protein
METNQYRTEQVFKRNSFVAFEKFSKEYISPINMTINNEGNDFITNQLTVRLKTDLYEQFIETRTFTKEFKRPTFFDWLFRRKTRYTFNVNVSEVTKYIPNVDNILRVEIK